MIAITYLIVWILIIYNSFTKLLYNHKLAEISGEIPIAKYDPSWKK